jgi:rod shape-determining protein MreC
LQKEISQLKKAMKFSKSFNFKKLEMAQVISFSNRFISSGLRVSTGSRKGVKAGMPVVSSKGLVGRVLRANYFFSDIQLVTDDNFVLDVFIERTRVRSLLQGAARGKCSLTMEKQVDVRIGDKLVTSGMLNIFPRGIPVGRVLSINFDSRREYQTVEVEPITKKDSLDYVVILKKLSEDQKLLKNMIEKEKKQQSKKK